MKIVHARIRTIREGCRKRLEEFTKTKELLEKNKEYLKPASRTNLEELAKGVEAAITDCHQTLGILDRIEKNAELLSSLRDSELLLYNSNQENIASIKNDPVYSSGDEQIKKLITQRQLGEDDYFGFIFHQTIPSKEFTTQQKAATTENDKNTKAIVMVEQDETASLAEKAKKVGIKGQKTIELCIEAGMDENKIIHFAHTVSELKKEGIVAGHYQFSKIMVEKELGIDETARIYRAKAALDNAIEKKAKITGELAGVRYLADIYLELERDETAFDSFIDYCVQTIYNTWKDVEKSREEDNDTAPPTIYSLLSTTLFRKWLKKAVETRELPADLLHKLSTPKGIVGYLEMTTSEFDEEDYKVDYRDNIVEDLADAAQED